MFGAGGVKSAVNNPSRVKLHIYLVSSPDMLNTLAHDIPSLWLAVEGYLTTLEFALSFSL